MSLRRQAVYLIILLCLTITCLAIPVHAEVTASEAGVPDWADYSRQVDRAETKFKSSANNQTALAEIAKDTLEAENYAQGCITKSEASLAKIIESMDSLGVANPHDGLSAPRKKLEKQKFDTEKQVSQCRLLSLRARELQEKARIAGQDLLKERLFASDSSLLDYLSNIVEKPGLLQQETLQIAQTLSSFSVNWPNVYLALAYGLVAFLAGLFWSIIKRRQYAQHAPDLTKTSPTLATVWNSTLRLMPMLLLFGLINLSFMFNEPGLAALQELALALLIFTVTYAILRAILRPNAQLSGFEPLLPLASAKLFFWGRLLLFATLLGAVFQANIFDSQTLISLTGLIRIVLGTLFGLALMRVIWLLRKNLMAIRQLYLHLIAILVMLVAIVALWLGYNNFALFLFYSVLGTLFILLLGWLLMRIPVEIFDGLDAGTADWQQKIRHKMGLEDNRIMPGLIWLRLVHGLLVVGTVMLALLLLWGMSEQSFDLMLSGITNGFEVGGFALEPMRIVNGLLLLALLIVLTQFMKRKLSSSWLYRTNLSRGAKEATVTILGYTGVALAVFIGLSVAGINFTNFAIIAGALSVGIGFGLQNIVNNFISGLILLFERPIRRGDWIRVGASEGYVKDISIRSTVIQTFDRSDIIVPNSELIANQVTNMMLSNQYGRIIIPIRVAYGTDTEQVIAVLKGVAEKHPAILREQGELQIQVFLRGFGETAMNFELRCHIKDVEWVLNITSELNVEVVKAFHEAGIIMPFPQQIVQVKTLDYQEAAKNTAS